MADKLNGRRIKSIGLIVAIVIMATMTACTSKQELTLAQGELQRTRADIQQLIQAVEPLADDPKIAKIIAVANKADEVVAQTQAALDSIGDSSDPGEYIRQGGSIIAPLLGPPYSQLAILGTALIGTLVSTLFKRSSNKATREKVAAEAKSDTIRHDASLIGWAIEKAKDDDGNVNFSDPATKRKLKADMGAAAAELVDIGRGKVEY